MNLFAWLDAIGAVERTYATAILGWLRYGGQKPDVPAGLGRARAQGLEYRVRSFLSK